MIQVEFRTVTRGGSTTAPVVIVVIIILLFIQPHIVLRRLLYIKHLDTGYIIMSTGRKCQGNSLI